MHAADHPGSGQGYDPADPRLCHQRIVNRQKGGDVKIQKRSAEQSIVVY
jgi:hypothetical protein